MKKQYQMSNVNFVLYVCNGVCVSVVTCVVMCSVRHGVRLGEGTLASWQATKALAKQAS